MGCVWALVVVLCFRNHAAKMRTAINPTTPATTAMMVVSCALDVALLEEFSADPPTDSAVVVITVCVVVVVAVVVGFVGFVVVVVLALVVAIRVAATVVRSVMASHTLSDVAVGGVVSNWAAVHLDRTLQTRSDVKVAASVVNSPLPQTVYGLQMRSDDSVHADDSYSSGEHTRHA